MLPLITKLPQRVPLKLHTRGVSTSSRDALLSAAKPEPVSEAPQNIERTTLEGGVQVVSVDVASPVTTLSLIAKAGSRYENRQTLHASLFLKHLAFKGTNDKSALRLVRDIEHIGGSYITALTREHLSYNLSALRTPGVSLDILSETLRYVLNPLLLEHEVETTRNIVSREAKEATSNYYLRLSELIHAEAFRDSGLANPLAPLEWRVSEVTPQEIHSFAKSNFYPGERITIVGTGIEHALLLEKVKPLFTSPSIQGKYRELQKLPKLVEDGPTPQNPQFVGSGVAVRITEAADTYVALGFPGFSAKSKELYALLALSEVLGDYSASSDVSYGSSNLQTSKLLEVGEHNPFIKNIQIENNSYSDTGVFILYAQAEPGHGKDLVNSLTTVTNKVADSVSSEEVEAAKLRVKNNYLRKISRCRGSFGYVLVNCGVSSAEYLSLVDAVSVADVKNVAKKVFGANPVVAGIGDVRGIPRLG